jgi:hypothetical protein
MSQASELMAELIAPADFMRPYRDPYLPLCALWTVDQASLTEGKQVNSSEEICQYGMNF